MAEQFRELQVQLKGLGSEQLNGVAYSVLTQTINSLDDVRIARCIWFFVYEPKLLECCIHSIWYCSAHLGATAGTVLNDGTTQVLGTGVAMSISRVTADELNTGKTITSCAQAGGKASLGFASGAHQVSRIEAANVRSWMQISQRKV